jgi:hypothetical protein
MLARNTCSGARSPLTATVFPFKSGIARTRSVPTSSKQPTCSPTSATIGSPVSRDRRKGPLKFGVRSISPEAMAACCPMLSFLTHCTSVNPSPWSSSSAKYWGARQMLELWGSLSRVVSGGGSAATGLGYQPRSPTVPASVTPLRNRRRLNGRACWVLMGTSFPEAGQRDTANAGQWTLLRSREQVQHLRLCRLQIVASTYGYLYLYVDTCIYI